VTRSALRASARSAHRVSGPSIPDLTAGTIVALACAAIDSDGLRRYRSPPVAVCVGMGADSSNERKDAIVVGRRWGVLLTATAVLVSAGPAAAQSTRAVARPGESLIGPSAFVRGAERSARARPRVAAADSTGFRCGVYVGFVDPAKPEVYTTSSSEKPLTFPVGPLTADGYVDDCSGSIAGGIASPVSVTMLFPNCVTLSTPTAGNFGTPATHSGYVMVQPDGSYYATCQEYTLSFYYTGPLP
jgi:hypothetical protein